MVSARLMISIAAILCAPSIAEGRLVKLNVAVTDHDGQPVTGLQTSDLKLQEDGRLRQIVFSRFTGPSSINAGQPDQTLGAGEYTNRALERPSAIVILLDQLNERVITDAAVISEQLNRAFRNLDYSDNLYLYFLTSRGELYPVHPLPTRGVASVKPASEPWGRNLLPLLGDTLKNLLRFASVDDIDVKTRVDLTASALQDLTSRMRVVPGRKNLVWVTRGIPLNGFLGIEHGVLSFETSIRIMAALLQHNEIVAYPVGARLDSERDRALTEIASITGGQKFGFGEVGDAVLRATSASRANYLIVYDSLSENTDGKHHTLRLTHRHKDVRVQTVTEFDDLMAFADPAGAEQNAIKLAVQSPFDASDIALRASASKGPNPLQEAFLDVRIDPADLLLRETHGRRTADVVILFARYGPSGLLQATMDATKPDVGLLQPQIDLTSDQYAAARREGIQIHQLISLDAGLRTVRVIVFDRELGTTGSVTIPILR